MTLNWPIVFVESIFIYLSIYPICLAVKYNYLLEPLSAASPKLFVHREVVSSSPMTCFFTSSALITSRMSFLKLLSFEDLFSRNYGNKNGFRWNYNHQCFVLPFYYMKTFLEMRILKSSLRLISTHLLVHFILYWTLSYGWVVINLFDSNIISSIAHNTCDTEKMVSEESSSWNKSDQQSNLLSRFLYLSFFVEQPMLFLNSPSVS